jgi:hypothetical protein
MKQFNKITCQALAREIEAALQAIATKHGLTVNSAGGTFSDVEYTSKMKFRVADAGAVESAERTDFSVNCSFFGLTADHYGRQFTHKGETYKLIGFTSRAKFCVKTRSVVGGRTMLFSEQILKLVA